MSNITDQQVADARAKLMTALTPHRGSPIMIRINGYVHDKTGKKLPDFLAAPGSNEIKHEILTFLSTVLEKGHYDKLPPAPSGQAQESSPPPAPPLVKPKPTPPAPVPAPAPITPPLPPEEVQIEDDDDPEVAEAKAQLALAEARRKALARKAEAAAQQQGMGEEQVRAIVNEEFKKWTMTSEMKHEIIRLVDDRVASIFETIVASLKEGGK